MQTIQDKLIKYDSLQVNIINSLTYILDNSKIMAPGALNDALISVINQLEVNSVHFNQILDTIQQLKYPLKLFFLKKVLFGTSPRS